MGAMRRNQMLMVCLGVSFIFLTDTAVPQGDVSQLTTGSINDSLPKAKPLIF